MRREDPLGQALHGAGGERQKTLLRATFIDFTWVAHYHASFASIAAIPIQDDANVTRYRLLLNLIENSALVNPIQETEEK